MDHRIDFGVDFDKISAEEFRNLWCDVQYKIKEYESAIWKLIESSNPHKHEALDCIVTFMSKSMQSLIDDVNDYYKS